MAGLLGPEELIADLQHTLQQRHPRPASGSPAAAERPVDREQIQWWARNQFHEFRNIHRFFGIRYHKCPVPELRRMLLENMVEEEGEDLFGGKYPSHRELWVQFAKGIGIAPRRYFQLRASAREFAPRWKCTFRWCNKATGRWRSAPVWFSRAAGRSA